MAGFLENNKIRIVLSNTESTRSNIFKYNSLTKNGEVRPSSTAGYFLATNPDTINEMIEFLNPDNDEFVVDVVKTRSYIEKMNQVVKMFSLSDFILLFILFSPYSSSILMLLNLFTRLFYQ